METRGHSASVPKSAILRRTSTLTSADAELRLINGLSIIGKFDGEFTSHSQTTDRCVLRVRGISGSGARHGATGNILQHSHFRLLSCGRVCLVQVRSRWARLNRVQHENEDDDQITPTAPDGPGAVPARRAPRRIRIRIMKDRPEHAPTMSARSASTSNSPLFGV
jgi:hypothetical protein